MEIVENLFNFNFFFSEWVETETSNYQKGKEVDRLGKCGESHYFISKGSCPCPLLRLIFPVSQVQIHSTCILTVHQLFPCNHLYTSFLFALENSITCHVISSPSKSKQTKSPLVSACRPIFSYVLCSPLQPSICPLLCFLIPCSKSGLPFFALHKGQQWPPLFCPSRCPSCQDTLPFCLSPTCCLQFCFLLTGIEGVTTNVSK